MRILFVTSNRLGDAVLSTGPLDHLIRTHPDARITVACGPVAEGVFARMPNRERTVTAHPPLMCSRHEAAKIALDMVTDDSIHRIRESRHAPHSSQG
jgi:ADP-heptose:LPS heptosyltransferase